MLQLKNIRLLEDFLHIPFLQIDEIKKIMQQNM